MKLWEGRFKKPLDKKTNDFNSSISFDSRMYKQDIMGSIAHAKMLAQQDIIGSESGEKIVEGLESILKDIESGKLSFDLSSEDIHTFIETELTKRIGKPGKMLHTGRSRNDQVALDVRLYLRELSTGIDEKLTELISVLTDIAQEHAETIMPSYTHLQRAQPITFGHHMMAYCEMLLRDRDRLSDAVNRMNISPLGSGALAATTYPLDREYVSELLSMSGVTHNSLDGVSDRDFVIELASVLSIVMVHLSRFSEEIIMWCSFEFKFIQLDDAFSTGSSIMPQKKNPDIAELVRGKSGRVFGNLTALLTMMKGLALAYNKDMQEDKEGIFDTFDTVDMCLTAFIPMIATMKVNKEKMRKAAAEGFINATDCADYLTKKGMPFREAYKIVGKLVAYCIDSEKTLESLDLKEFKGMSEEFENDVYDAISLENCVSQRSVYGGPAPKRVLEQVSRVRKIIDFDR